MAQKRGRFRILLQAIFLDRTGYRKMLEEEKHARNRERASPTWTSS
jgi:hypothetical protein